MGSKEVYHRITHAQTTGVANNGTSGPREIVLQMPTSRNGNALWELVSFTYHYVAGGSSTMKFALGEATGFASNDENSVFESEALAKSPTFRQVDLAGVAQTMQRGMIVASPDASSKLYLRCTVAGSSSNNTFTLKLTFRQLKGSNIAGTNATA